MPGDKLLYFKGLRARGEAARMLLIMSGKPYELEDISFEEWPARKPEIPTGKLPALTTEDGKYLGQSQSICRYLAKKHGLMGKDIWEEAQNDYMMESVADATDDVGRNLSWLAFGKPRPDDADKIIDTIKEKWTKLTTLVAEQGKTRKFVLSDEIQLADVWLYVYMEVSSVAFPGIFSVNTWIKDWMERFTNDARVRKHLDTRPKDATI